MSVVLFLHLFSFFFFSYFLTYNFNGQTVGNHGSTETYWWLWVTSLNHISKESHKDGSRDGMWSTTMYWFSAYKLISAGIFLSGPDKGFMLDQITKASFLNELLYTDLLVSSSLFFLCCSKWSHQLLHCAWEDLLILCSSETSLLNNAPEIVGDWWIWHRPFSHWSGQEWLEVF